MVNLTPLDILNGTTGLLTFGISLIIGLTIVSKYFKYKDRVFLLVGIVAILITEPWWPSSIGFLVILAGGELTTELFVILANIFIPLSVFLWLTAFTDLKYKREQKRVLRLAALYGVLYEVFFFILFFTNISLLGEIGTGGTFDTNYGLFIILNQISLLLVVLVTGNIFARESLKSDNREIRLKGRLLILAFYFFMLGAILDVLSPMSPVLLVLARLILITAAIAFYGGFILPDWMKKLFFKDFTPVRAKISKTKDYEKAYEILMEYWDYIPAGEKSRVKERLSKLGL
jgi:hypothetical protein